MTAPVIAPLTLLLRWALDPTPDEAREALARELSRAEYQPSLAERIDAWIDRLLGEVARAAQEAGSPGPVVALVLLVLLVALVVVVLLRLQRTSAATAPDAEVFAEARLGAEEHRRRAAQALAEERYDDALVESVRALTAGLVERQLLPDERGTTVREVAARVSALFPAEVSEVDAVTLAFEETVYGDRPAGAEQARRAATLEQRVRHAVPTPGGGGPVAAVPR